MKFCVWFEALDGSVGNGGVKEKDKTVWLVCVAGACCWCVWLVCVVGVCVLVCVAGAWWFMGKKSPAGADDGAAGVETICLVGS